MDFSTDHAAAIDAVGSLRAKPNAATRLYDTAIDAVKKSAEIPKGRRAVILLTDGKDEKAGAKFSTHGLADVIDAATTKAIRVPIYTIGVGPQVDAKELGRMAALTGGRSLLATSLDDLPGFYETLANQLKNQYLIKYYTQSTSGEHSVVIKARFGESLGQDEKRFWTPPLPVLRPPSVSFVSPGPGDPIRDIVTVNINITPEDTVARVRYYVDGVLKGENSRAPFDSFDWDTAGLPGGLHMLRVEVVDVNGQSGFAEMTATVKAPAAAAPEPHKSEPVKKRVSPAIIWGIAIVLLLAVVGGGLFWWRRQGREEPAEEPSPLEAAYRPSEQEAPQRDFEDETQYMPDFGETMESMASGAKERSPLATLTVLKSMNLDPGKTFDLSIATTTIGRTSGNDIFIPDKPVSRKHAEIKFDGSAFYIMDLGSKNGTKVDGETVSSEPKGLYDNAQIQLSTKTILEFKLIPQEEEEVDEDDITKVSDEDDSVEDDATKVYE
jgi:FHA domain-containing protein/Big-like domain-containing protein